MVDTERILRIGRTLTMFSWIVSFVVYQFLYEYYTVENPIVPNKAAGYVYPHFQHGSIVFISVSEKMYLSIASYVAIASFVLAVIFEVVLKRIRRPQRI